jgi:hypothetical protein
MLGQHRDDDIARVAQDGFLFVRRDLDEAKSSEQENSVECESAPASRNGENSMSEHAYDPHFGNPARRSAPMYFDRWLGFR